MLVTHHQGRFIVASLALCAIVAVEVPFAAAQAVYGSISGTIRDNSGGILPGVTVTVTSVEREHHRFEVDHERVGVLCQRPSASRAPTRYQRRTYRASNRRDVSRRQCERRYANAASNLTLELGGLGETGRR